MGRRGFVAMTAVCLVPVGGAYGQFGGIDPVSVYDPLYGPSTLSSYGQHWIPTTRVNYAWTLVGYDPDEPPSVNFSDPNTTIAIIDTGIDSNHPEFFGNGDEFVSKIHPDSRTMVEGGDSFHPQLACPCDPESYSVPDTEDTIWNAVPGANPHGTISAGIAAAYAGNGEGIAGTCWECSVLVLRVSAFIENTQEPTCTLALEGCTYNEQTIADAINYAAGWNPDDDTWGPVRARVICTAITTDSIYDDVCDGTNLIAQAVDEAYSRGCVIIAIATNSGAALSTPCWDATDPDDPNCLPNTSWQPELITHGLALNPKTITVGGACRTGSAWHCQSKINPPIGDLGSCASSLYPYLPFDNTAPVLSVVVPTEDMVVTRAYDEATMQGAEYGFLNETNAGTSWGSPQVAGVVALMLGQNPALTPSEVKYILHATATDIGASGYDRYTGHGLMNAEKAIEYVQKHTLPADWNGDGSIGPIDPILYTADYLAGDPMTDLNLDEVQTTDDMTVFLNSYNGN